MSRSEFSASLRWVPQRIAKPCRRMLSTSLLVAIYVGLVSAQMDGNLSNPILRGDHPDPTIVRIGRTYWTASTSGDWAPVFPLYRSVGLRRWIAAGAIFPKPPGWAEGSFWAPEMVVDGGRVLVYYVGRRRGGPLCVAAATADRPEGPYVDRGPIVCQADGSIDPAFARDEHGLPFLVWKEDGNSQHQPTTIWAQPLTSDLLHLSGEKTALLVNEPESWEGGVIEAPYILQRQGHFYLFYAGNACCGVQCHYAEGVARADRLLGPWTRDPENPIIRPNGSWRCPGHGTAVQTPAGKDLFIYHAYPAVGNVYLGRESVLDSVTWTQDGWPVVNQGRGPGTGAAGVQAGLGFRDAFRGPALDPEWKWPVGREPAVHVFGGKLTIEAPTNGGQAFIARSPLASAYTARVGVLPTGTAAGGLAIIGDAKNEVGLSRRDGELELWRRDQEERPVLWTKGEAPGKVMWLRVSSAGNEEASFSFSADGKVWSPAGVSVSLKELLPWDQGLRVGLLVDGPAGSSVSFTQISIAALPNQAGD